jgi:hypothetical protein
MSAQNWSKIAGEILGKVTGIWFGIAVAALLLSFPTKCIVWVIQWIWGLF